MAEIDGTNLDGMKIACVATNGFEFVELDKPKKALEKAGATVEVISPEAGEIQGVDHDEKHPEKTPVDKTFSEAVPDEYDALLLPGGVANPDHLRLSDDAISFIKHFIDEGKPIAAICHGPWTLINAGGVDGKTMTSWPSLQADLENAGAAWVDQEVVRDGMLVTSRKPDDIPAFNGEMIALFAEMKS
jgi:protease I